MASLTLSIGPLTASTTASDAKATDILIQYADSIGASGTNQQRANAVVQALTRYMVEQAKAQRARSAQAEATEAAQEEIDGIGWS